MEKFSILRAIEYIEILVQSHVLSSLQKCPVHSLQLLFICMFCIKTSYVLYSNAHQVTANWCCIPSMCKWQHSLSTGSSHWATEMDRWCYVLSSSWYSETGKLLWSDSRFKKEMEKVTVKVTFILSLSLFPFKWDESSTYII